MTSRALIVGGLGHAARFLRPAWKQAWAAMAIAAGLVGGLWALWLFSPLSPWRFEALMAAGLALVVVQGGLYRLALGAGPVGPAGLQWGAQEWRLCVVWALTAVFLFVLGLLGFVVLLAFAFAAASSGHGFVVALPSTWAGAVDDRGRAVVAVVASAVLAGLIWASVKICLGSVASVAKGRIQVLASWPDTRGIVAPLLVSRLLLALVPLGLTVAVGWRAPTGMAGSGLTAWAGRLAAGAAIAGLWLPMNVGLMAYFYRRSATP